MKHGREGQARRFRVWGRGGWTVAGVMFVYFAAGYGFEWHLCPADMFEVSNQAGVLSFLAVFGAACGLGFAVWRVLDATAVAAVPGQVHAPRRPTGAALLLAAALAVGAAAWANYFLRYACFAPDRITLHPNPFGAARIVGWDRVTRVGASCWQRKGSRQAELLFWLDTGERVSMELSHGEATFRDASAALEGREVQYVRGVSVTADNCPADVYPALQGWAG